MVTYLNRDKYPSKEYLDECFYYDLVSGNLIWKERPRHHFKTESAMKCTNARWCGKTVLTKNTKGYIRAKVGGYNLFVHRIVFIMLYGYNPENLVDHKNMDNTCNVYRNLREVTHSCNVRNSKVNSTNSLGITGVSFGNGKYRASITKNRRCKIFGMYQSLDRAVIARWLAEQELGWYSCQEESSAYRYLKSKGLATIDGLTDEGLGIISKYPDIKERVIEGKKVIINNTTYNSIGEATRRILKDYPDKNFETVRKEIRNIVSGKRKEGYMYNTLEIRRYTPNQ